VSLHFTRILVMNVFPAGLEQTRFGEGSYFLRFLTVLVHKGDHTQNYDPGRTSYHTPFSPSHRLSMHYNKTHKSRLKYDLKYDLQKT